MLARIYSYRQSRYLSWSVMRLFIGTEGSILPSARIVLSCQKGYLSHSESTGCGRFLVNSIEGLYAMIMLNATIERPRKKFMLAAVLTAAGVYSVHENFICPNQASPG